MNRRNFLTGLGAAAVAKPSRPPNFLLIFSDDQGWNDVSAYGSEIPTPNTDGIGRAGVKFERFYVAAPVCTPSRYGLLTGRYPVRSQDKMLNALMPPSTKGLHAGETTIAEMLKTRGYRTALIGKWHLGSAQPEFLPNSHGFDYFDGFLHGCIDYFNFTYGGMPSWFRNREPYLPPKGYTTDYITDQAIRFLGDNRRNPFFLYLPYNAPHYGKLEYDPKTRKSRNGLQAPEEYIRRFSHIADEKRRVYAAMVSSLDDNVGRLLKALRDLNLEENTLVAFISDNGGATGFGGSNIPLRGHKSQLFDGGIRVPCLMQWKGRLGPARHLRQVAGAVDIVPTLCALAGATPPPGDGRDLGPALFENRHFDRQLYWRTEKDGALLDGRWKYIRTSAGEEYLFDLENDPNETANRTGDPSAPAEGMKRKYERVEAN